METHFNNALITFMPEGDYDHCPGLVSMHKDNQGRKPVRFFSMWVTAPGYKRFVSRVWNIQIRGVI